MKWFLIIDLCFFIATILGALKSLSKERLPPPVQPTRTGHVIGLVIASVMFFWGVNIYLNLP